MKEVLAPLEFVRDYQRRGDTEPLGLLGAAAVTVGAQVVVVVVVVVLDVLLQDVVEVAVVEGVAPGTAHLAVDAAEAVGGAAPVPGSGPPSSAGRARLGLRPRGSPGGQEEHTGRGAGGEQL